MYAAAYDADHTFALKPLTGGENWSTMSRMGDSTDSFASQPKPTQDPDPFIPPYVKTPPARQRNRTRIAVVVTTCLAVLALGAGSAAYVYSNNSAREWRATAEQLSAELGDMTAQRQQVQGLLDASQTALAATKASLEKVTEEYNDASERIRDLADEKAQAADTVGVLGSAVERSRNVALRLDQCVAGLQELQDYLIDIDSYDITVVLGVAEEINDGCDEAQAASDAFVNWLEGD
jgi:Skp family chaperone for outer membrane proteins